MNKKILRPISGPVSQNFGENFVTSWGTMAYRQPPGHPGIDYAVMVGTPVVACDKGTIINASDRGDGYGNLIIILHDWGVSLYGHLSSFLLTEGEQVNIGNTIGKSGNTGFSTGPHLHFEIQINGVAIDPAPFITTNINEVQGMLTKQQVDRAYWSILKRAPEPNCPYIGSNMLLEDMWSEIGDSAEHNLVCSDALKWRQSSGAGSGNTRFELVDFAVYRKIK